MYGLLKQFVIELIETLYSFHIEPIFIPVFDDFNSTDSEPIDNNGIILAKGNNASLPRSKHKKKDKAEPEANLQSHYHSSNPDNYPTGLTFILQSTELFKDVLNRVPGVYIIMNTITSEFYIGSTINILSRILRYLYILEDQKDNVNLKQAIAKDGIAAIQVTILSVTLN